METVLPLVIRPRCRRGGLHGGAGAPDALLQQASVPLEADVLHPPQDSVLHRAEDLVLHPAQDHLLLPLDLLLPLVPLPGVLLHLHAQVSDRIPHPVPGATVGYAGNTIKCTSILHITWSNLANYIKCD